MDVSEKCVGYKHKLKMNNPSNTPQLPTIPQPNQQVHITGFKVPFGQAMKFGAGAYCGAQALKFVGALAFGTTVGSIALGTTVGSIALGSAIVKNNSNRDRKD